MTKLLPDLVNDLESDEGSGPTSDGRFFVYDDATGQRINPGSIVRGNPTIGNGRCLNTNGISDYERKMLLSQDCDIVIEECEKYDWFDLLSHNRQRVIANMIFQLGATRFALFRTMIDCIEQSDWQGAHNAMLSSLWAKQVPNRANKLATNFLAG